MANYTVIFKGMEVFEGVVNGPETLDFQEFSKKITITNDHASKDMTFKFSASGAPATLKPGETVSWNFMSLEVIIDGDVVDYRIWIIY